jgi:WD40 repeat protein
LIACWDIDSKKFQFPMLGLTNRINAMDQSREHIYSSSNDCTVRQWQTETGICLYVFKFSDPVSVTKIDPINNFLFTASWDKMIRVIDLEKQIVLKAWIASKETIKEMCITDEELIVAGCDPIIRSYNLETGAVKMY